jgi:hypothetical protein
MKIGIPFVAYEIACNFLTSGAVHLPNRLGENPYSARYRITSRCLQTSS